MKTADAKRRGRPVGSRDRVPRVARAPQAQRPGMVFTERDLTIVEAVYRYRVMTRYQIERLLFPATSSAQVRLRLRLLFQHGYLLRQEQLQRRSEGLKSYLYFLDKRGVDELAILYGCDVDELDWNKDDCKTGYLHLSHLLLSHDIRIAVTLSAQQHGYTVVEWKDEKILRREHRADTITIPLPTGVTQTTHVIPDGFFLLARPSPTDTEKTRYSHRFIEIDRATVTGKANSEQNRSWEKKILAYLAWHRSGKYQERYKANTMGVLTVTSGERRLENLKHITEEAGGKERFWFTCLERLSGADILTDLVWSVATTAERRSIVERA